MGYKRFYWVCDARRKEQKNHSTLSLSVSVSIVNINRTGIILRTGQLDTFTEVRFLYKLVITYKNSSSHLS